MTSPNEPFIPVANRPGARHLSRGITVAWWYTVAGILTIELVMVGAWAAIALVLDRQSFSSLIVAGGGLIWCASTVFMMLDYRRRSDEESAVRWRRLAAPILVAVLYGAAAGAVVGSWQLALIPIVQALVLLNWPRGVRYKVVVAVTILLIALAAIDSPLGDSPEGDSLFVAVITVILPAMTVSSLWWWDVLITLDRARASEAKLAATQERLRVATDVHDLQGHHLQVIALQLELAERLLPDTPEEGMEQLRAARVSVDDARRGTRDLAMRFRSVPLGDELANARDLLTAAGLEVEAVIDAAANSAPASALGPVIRETTTNVLRHGGGKRARLSLTRTADAWRYEIANDPAPGGEHETDGSGLAGVQRRIEEADGAVEIRRSAHDFVVVVTVPPAGEGAR